jgi:hypothetical protein
MDCSEEMIKRCIKESDQNSLKGTADVGICGLELDGSYTSLVPGLSLSHLPIWMS